MICSRYAPSHLYPLFASRFPGHSQLRKIMSASVVRIKALEERQEAPASTSTSDSVDAVRTRLEKVEMVIKAQQQAMNTIRGGGVATGSQSSDSSSDERLAALVLRMGKVENRLTTINESPVSTAPVSTPAPDERVTALLARMIKVEAALEKTSRIDSLEVKIKAMEEREAALAKQLAAATAHIARIEKNQSTASIPVVSPLPPSVILPPPPAIVPVPLISSSSSSAASSPRKSDSNIVISGEDSEKKSSVDVTSILESEGVTHTPLSVPKRSRPRGGTRKLPSRKKEKEEEEGQVAVEEKEEVDIETPSLLSSKLNEESELHNAEKSAVKSAERKGSRIGIGLGVLPGMQEAVRGRRRSSTLGVEDMPRMRRLSEGNVPVEPVSPPVGPHLLKKTANRPLKKAPPKIPPK